MLSLNKLINKKTKLNQPVVVEFWIYCNAARLPSDEMIMDRMIGRNPHNQNGQHAVLSDEAVLMSDVRFHIGFSLHEKNPHLFDANDERFQQLPENEREEALNANAVAIVRFVSETPVHGWKHLHFLTHATDAVADLTRNGIIYDCEAARFWSREEWQAGMMKHGAAFFIENQLNIHAETHEQDRWVHSHGMRKFGLPDLEMIKVPHAHGALAHNLLWQVARIAVDKGEIPQEIELEMFGYHQVSIAKIRKNGSPHHRGMVIRLWDEEMLNTLKTPDDDDHFEPVAAEPNPA